MLCCRSLSQEFFGQKRLLLLECTLYLDLLQILISTEVLPLSIPSPARTEAEYETVYDGPLEAEQIEKELQYSFVGRSPC